MNIPPSGVCTIISSVAGPFPFKTETVILILYHVFGFKRVILYDVSFKQMPRTSQRPMAASASR